MTSEELKAIEERCEKATEGPWEGVIDIGGSDDDDRDFPAIVSDCANKYIARTWEKLEDCPDAQFIAAARQDIPLLCAALRKALSLINRSCNNCKHKMPFEDPYCDDCDTDYDKWEMED